MSNKGIIILMMGLLPCLLSAQNINPGIIASKPETYKRLSITAHLSTDHTLSVGEGAVYYPGALTAKGSRGFTAGLQIGYLVTPRLEIGTGIRYSHHSFGVDDQCEECVFVQYLWPDMLRTHFQSLEVPLYARYYFVDRGRIRLFAQAGVVNSFSLPDRSIRNLDGDVVPAHGRQLYNVNAEAGLGMQIKLAKNISLEAGVLYKQALNRYMDHGNLKPGMIKPFLGMNFRF